ncbi:MAG: hypothetical protein JRH06_06045 [Deltaproteobacteria bacterium]|nr:hypothetical protein [Deltaproteobacteria bacterium]MBW2137099.1 hypothetical protein [Deltaproteobacteria bacterium]
MTSAFSRRRQNGADYRLTDLEERRLTMYQDVLSKIEDIKGQLQDLRGHL